MKVWCVMRREEKEKVDQIPKSFTMERGSKMIKAIYIAYERGAYEIREVFLKPSYQSAPCDIQMPTSDKVYRLSLAIRCGSRSASFLCLHSAPLIWGSLSM